MLLEIELGVSRGSSERRHSAAQARMLATELSVANSAMQPYPLIIRRSRRRTAADIVQPQVVPSPISSNQAQVREDSTFVEPKLRPGPKQKPHLLLKRVEILDKLFYPNLWLWKKAENWATVADAYD